MVWVRRLILYVICGACGCGCAWVAQKVGLRGERLENLFGGLAYLLGIVQSLLMLLAKTWADLKVGDGVRAHAREAILNEARVRKQKVFLRLGIGILSALMLKTASALLLDSQKVVSPAWSAIGFTALAISIACLVFSIVDYYLLTELKSRLDQRAEDERRRKREAEALETEPDVA